jgi:large subunit ribosomal protein L9
MKIILTEKITKLGNIGDTVGVATGYARNYLLPKGKAMRFSRENSALFENKKAELVARHESAKKTAESNLPKITGAKLHLIRSAGDTGHLYGSVSSRDIARLVRDLTNVDVLSEQVLLGGPIKEIGAWDVKVALHPDVIADIMFYDARTQDEIDALVAGKSIKKDLKIESSGDDSAPEAAPASPAAESAAEAPVESSAKKSKKSPAE